MHAKANPKQNSKEVLSPPVDALLPLQRQQFVDSEGNETQLGARNSRLQQSAADQNTDSAVLRGLPQEVLRELHLREGATE